MEIDSGATIGLMKFFSCHKYAEDLINGKFFCHESGWFRKLGDNFRGDKYDGIRPINIDGMTVEFGGIIGTGSGIMTKGFECDDKLPIYCLTIVDINILDKVNYNTYFIKPAFVEKMKQFGEYVVFIPYYDKFINDITGYSSTNNLTISCSRVKYVKILNEYLIGEKKKSRSLKQFFTKDSEYEYQNEFRIIWQRQDGLPMIDNLEDSITINIGHPFYGSIMSIYEVLTIPLIFSVGM